MTDEACEWLYGQFRAGGVMIGDAQFVGGTKIYPTPFANVTLDEYRAWVREHNQKRWSKKEVAKT